jgi:hypothetical protein
LKYILFSDVLSACLPADVILGDFSIVLCDWMFSGRAVFREIFFFKFLLLYGVSENNTFYFITTSFSENKLIDVHFRIHCN